MTIPSELDVVVAPVPAVADNSSYVDWPAIIAGIVIASAISLVLLSFGSAIGLSFVNFHAGPDVPVIWIAIAAALWLLWVELSSFMAGAYVTGRMRRRHNDATEDEVDLRDGVHGLLVWGGALVIGGLLALGGISAAVNAVGGAAATVTQAAATAADDAGATLDPNAYFVDTLFRPSPTAAATPAANPTELRAEAGRILAQAVTGPVNDADKAYLAQVVAANTGLTADEATARVNEVLAAVDDAKAKAAAAAETARKTGIVAAFLTAASLLVSAVAAFWAAQMGGNHRDNRTVFRNAFRRV